MEISQVAVLRDKLVEAVKDEPVGHEVFQRLIQESEQVLELTDEDVAHFVDVCIPSVTRWRTGKSTPHPFVRSLVCRTILEHIQQKVL